MRDYKKLDVWKKSHEMYMFVKKEIAPEFPKEERYESTSQLLRAALSVPLNIGEGCDRFIDRDFARFLDNDLGSTNETGYSCFTASELEVIANEQYTLVNKLVNEVRGHHYFIFKIFKTRKLSKSGISSP